jgi:hypothetical protein
VGVDGLRPGTEEVPGPADQLQPYQRLSWASQGGRRLQASGLGVLRS